jgi:N utilization substance protein A
MDLREFNSAVAQIAEEKGIPKELIFTAVSEALATAYKKEYGRRGQKISNSLNPETLEVDLFLEKEVVDPQKIREKDQEFLSEYQFELEEEVASRPKPTLIKKEAAIKPVEPKQTKPEKTDDKDKAGPQEPDEDKAEIKFRPARQILLPDARKFSKKARPGDVLLFPLKPREDFGRIAAQAAKQVILQKLQEAERNLSYEEYKQKEATIISGIIQGIEQGTVYLDLGRTTGILSPGEQIPGESYRPGERIKAYVTKVELGRRGPMIFLSRTHPQMMVQMFALEVPEIASGLVEIKAIAREPGSRSKIAVNSKEPEIDPIGACVGQKGSRITAIINEFNGEKIDVIAWKEEPAEFIANALSPAKVLNVELNPETREATAVISEDQLSLAIGKRGQNVRLAAKLTGWKINAVLPETKTPKTDKAPAKEAPIKKEKGKKN